MAQTLNLTTEQRASLRVGLAYSDGSVAALGTQFRYVFDPTGIASIVPGDNVLWISGDAPGATTLTIRDMDAAFSEVVEVTVAGDPPAEPPAAPVPVGLAVVIGSPETK